MNLTLKSVSLAAPPRGSMLIATIRSGPQALLQGRAEVVPLGPPGEDPQEGRELGPKSTEFRRVGPYSPIPDSSLLLMPQFPHLQTEWIN